MRMKTCSWLSNKYLHIQMSPETKNQISVLENVEDVSQSSPSLTWTLSCSGVGLLLVSWWMFSHLHGALHSASALVPQRAAAAAGLPPGWAVLLREEARDRDGTAATHQPPPESSTAHRHHLCREQQVYSQTFIFQPFVQDIVPNRWGSSATSEVFVSV